MKLAVTGASGLVGTRIIELLKNDFEIVPISSADCDITQEEQVKRKIDSLDLDTLLHLAAYTNVDGAETEKEKAYDLNVNATKYLGAATKAKGKHMIYISTDFVFDGTTPPYDETSTPHPLGYYAQTKYEGEQAVKDTATIVRISYPYGSTIGPKPDFVHRIKSLLEEGRTLKMITDSSMTPTYIDDIAYALKKLIDQNLQPTTHNSPPTTDLYHFVGSQSISPYQSGQMIARHFHLPLSQVQPVSFIDYMKGKANRPQYSEIKSVKNDFFPMKSFEDGLAILDS